MYVLEQLQQKSLKELKEIGWQFNVMPEGDKRCRQNWIDAIVGVNFPLLQLLEVSPAVEEVESAAEAIAPFDPVQEPIIETVEVSPGVEFDPLLGAIVPAAETSPGSRSKASIAHQLLELFKSSAHILQPVENSPGVKTEETVSESAIGPAAKNPILIGVTLSDRFSARYSPPQAEIIHFQSDADGQLSLLNFEIESASEPPDPDDFESIEEFREAISRWDREHPEELAVSLDFFCEWAPCPDTWYESAEVVEVAPEAIESSITSNEPPAVGVGVCCFQSTPPNFPADVRPNAYQTQLKRIPKSTQSQLKVTLSLLKLTQSLPARSHKLLFRRTARHRDLCKIAQIKTPHFSPDGGQLDHNSTTTQLVCSCGANQQPARSPPGGDASF